MNTEQKLFQATETGDIESVKTVLQEDSNLDLGMALISAAEGNHAEIVTLLLENGADHLAYNSHALGCAAAKGHSESVKILLQAGNYRENNPTFALQTLAAIGETKEVEAFIKAGVDPKAGEDNAINWAALNHHDETTALLLKTYKSNELKEFLKRKDFVPHGLIQKELKSRAQKAAAKIQREQNEIEP